MKRSLYFVTGIVLGVLVTAITSRLRAQDPVKLSPQYYSVRFENDRVRVLEYRLKPGEKEPMHSHPPGVVFYLANATFRTTHPDGTILDTPVTEGQVIWREATTHAAENAGKTEAHAFAVEMRPCSPAQVKAAAPGPAPCELCGTWTLVDRIDRRANGEVVPEPNLGQDPLGILVYDRAGNVAVQLMRRNRIPNRGSVVTQATGSPDNSGTEDGYDAYFGKYEVDHKDHTVTHSIEGGIAPTDVGKALTRTYARAGDELTLSFETSNGGASVRRTLRWRRVA
jgi:quercetin dioxygenase-like cupin family protein